MAQIDVDQTCETCKKVFHNREVRRFCGVKCRRYGVGVCEICEEPFHKKTPTVVVCSKACYNQRKACRTAIRRLRKPKKPNVAIPCKHCGYDIQPHPVVIRNIGRGRITRSQKRLSNGRKYHAKCYRIRHNLRCRALKRISAAYERGRDLEATYEGLRSLIEEITGAPDEALVQDLAALGRRKWGIAG